MARDYEGVFRSHYAPLVRALTLSMGNAEDAADVVQYAFVQLHRHWRRIESYDDPVGWLRRVAANRALNQRRGDRRRERAFARLQTSALPPAAPLDDRIWLAVRALPRQQRTAIGLHYLADLDVHDVALAMDISPGTVKTHLHDGRRRLRELLEVSDDA